MDKYTKGPWKITATRGRNYIWHNGILVAELSSYTDIKSANSDERQANANLIAAAPEMLEALKELVFSPVVRGMSARIRIEAVSERGIRDPYRYALEIIKKVDGE